MTHDPIVLQRCVPRNGRWLALLLWVSLAAGPGGSLLADDPPKGFVWENLAEIHSRLARPEPWYFVRKPTPDAAQYFISKEKVEGGGDFETGLTLYAFTRVSDKTGKSADQSAEALLAITAAEQKVLRQWTKAGDPFTTHALLYVITSKKGVEHTVKNLYIANRKTGTLYLWILEGPSADWKEIDRVGDAMIASLHLNPGY